MGSCPQRGRCPITWMIMLFSSSRSNRKTAYSRASNQSLRHRSAAEGLVQGGEPVVSSSDQTWSHRLHIEAPHEPIGIAPLRLALDDEGLAIDRELIIGARARDFAHPHLESCGLGVDAGLAEPDDGVGAPCNDPHAYRVAFRGR